VVATELQLTPAISAKPVAPKGVAGDSIDVQHSLFEVSRCELRFRKQNGFTRFVQASARVEAAGPQAPPHEAKNRYISPIPRELAEAARERKEGKKKQIRLAEEFARAARGEEVKGRQAAAPPEGHSQRRSQGSRPEFDAAAADPNKPDGGDGGLAETSQEARPDGDGSGGGGTPQPRCTRKRDLDRGR
jgi:hypothetical protein